MVTFTLPPMRRPVIPRSGAFPAARSPDVAAAAPVPVTAHPEVVGCRWIAWVLGTRWWWGHSDGRIIVGVIWRYGAPACEYGDDSGDQQYFFHHESFENCRNQRVLNRDSLRKAPHVKMSNAGLGGLADGDSRRLQHLHISSSGMAKIHCEGLKRLRPARRRTDSHRWRRPVAQRFMPANPDCWHQSVNRWRRRRSVLTAHLPEMEWLAASKSHVPHGWRRPHAIGN